MLAVSFVVARWVVRRWRIGSIAPALACGSAALVMLMLGEYAIALLTQTLGTVAFVRERFAMSNVLGLAAKLVFLALPALIVRFAGLNSNSNSSLHPPPKTVSSTQPPASRS